MIDYMSFWFAKMLVEFSICVAIIVFVMLLHIAIQLYSDYNEKKYWRSQTKQWRYVKYHNLMSSRYGVNKWQTEMYLKDQE